MESINLSLSSYNASAMAEVVPIDPPKSILKFVETVKHY
jgi:hypothetical protein